MDDPTSAFDLSIEQEPSEVTATVRAETKNPPGDHVAIYDPENPKAVVYADNATSIPR